MTRLFIDTLFVVALINQRDQYHRRALALADRYESYPLLTTECVLLEIGNALARNFKKQAIEIIDEFRSSDEVIITTFDNRLFDEAYGLYTKYRDKEWGLIDCVSFVVMKEAGIDRALTFDQHFVQAVFQALLRDESKI